jgi:hypothetical protein
VEHRSVTMSSNPPYELHWFNDRAAMPSNKSPTKDETYRMVASKVKNEQVEIKQVRNAIYYQTPNMAYCIIRNNTLTHEPLFREEYHHHEATKSEQDSQVAYEIGNI